MSTKSSEKSTEALPRQGENSVYDFLYYDVGRIGSFLGQFDPDGTLQSRKRLANIERGSQSKASYAARGGIPKIAEGSTSYEDGDSERYGKSAEHVYDPQWANALTFLEYLEERKLLHRNIQTASLGQFVLVSGTLTVQDMSLFKEMIENPTLKKYLIDVISPPTPAGPRQAKSKTLTDAELALALIPLLPQLVQAHIVSGGDSIWCALNPDRLSLAAGDLQLKHGSKVAGSWSVLGVLDALPLGGSAPEATPQSLLHALGAFSDTMRPLLGRPINSFGITPLIVFREISTAEPEQAS